MQYVLTTEDLEKKYKNFNALNGLSMHVPKGSIYGFVGRNGAGKTTLIRLICGLQNPTGGKYSIYEHSYTEPEIKEARRRMGAVVETPSIYLDMSAEDNMKEQYHVLGLPSYEGIDSILKLVGLTGTGEKKAKNFSLGMKQRLGIAIALASDPDFLVLDEPINGLDPQGIIEMRELILKLNKEQGITILISSHILDELGKLATHYGFIDNGHMVKEISAEELEHACRKCAVFTVSDTESFSKVAERLHMDYEILSDNQTELFGEFVLTDLVLELKKENCIVTSIREQDETLEAYYMNLLGTQQDPTQQNGKKVQS